MCNQLGMNFQLTTARLIKPQTEEDHANPNFPATYPATEGPTNAPRENPELKNPDTRPYVCRLSSNPLFLKTH